MTSKETNQSGCVKLRPARPSDLPDVLALLRQSALPVEGVDAEALATFVIAEHEGAPIGVVGVEVYRESALLRSAAVQESWRGTGVGRALVDRALDLTRERGIRDVFLLTTSAENYFPRFGFACISRESVPEAVKCSAEFQGACPSTAVVMRKAIR
jgi:amino-acid N-acetyltransferase